MQLLVVNDIRGRADYLEAVLSSAGAPTPAAIIVLGNLVAAPSRREAHMLQEHNQFLTERLKAALIREKTDDRQAFHTIAGVLSRPGIPTFVIPGEMDVPLPALQEALLAASGSDRLHFVHRRAALLGPGMLVAGFGGRLSATGPDSLLLHYADWEAQAAFEHLQSASPLFSLSIPRIFLFATPLRSQRIDVEDGLHTGRSVLNGISRQYQPHLICCAGPHESRGVEIVDGMTVVNPGSLAQGSYATVAIDGTHTQTRLEQLHAALGYHTPAEVVA